MLLAFNLLILLPLSNLLLGHAHQPDCKLSDDDGVEVENAALLQTKAIVAHEGEDGLKDQASQQRHPHEHSLIKSGLTGLQVTRASGRSTSEETSLIIAAMDARKQDLASFQWEVMTSTTILLLLLSVALAEQVYRCRHAPIWLATLSCIFFGMDDFFIAYAGAYLRVPNAHMTLMFLFIGVIVISLHVPLVLWSSTYNAQFWHLLSSPKSMLACIALTAVFINTAEICSNIGFSLNLQESGPYQALSACNVLIVCPFFYYFYGEILTLLQLSATALLMIGTATIADVLHWSNNSISLWLFVWTMLSVLLYSFSDITLRLSSISGLAWQPRVTFMLLVMGAFGFPMYFIDQEGSAFAEYYETPTLLVWPFLNALAEVLGLLSCTIAFEAPDAPCGVLTAIVHANTVVLVTMNKFILGYNPSVAKLLGMGFIMVGVAMFHVTYNSEGDKRELAESPRKHCQS